MCHSRGEQRPVSDHTLRGAEQTRACYFTRCKIQIFNTPQPLRRVKQNAERRTTGLAFAFIWRWFYLSPNRDVLTDSRLVEPEREESTRDYPGNNGLGEPSEVLGQHQIDFSVCHRCSGLGTSCCMYQARPRGTTLFELMNGSD